MAGYQNPEYKNDNYVIPGVKIPGDYQPLKDAQKFQLAQAKKFRESIPEFSNKLYNQAEKDSKQRLAQGIKDVRSDFNRRGLLRSGMRQGAEYGRQADSASELIKARGDINKGLLSTADELENNAFNTAGSVAGLGPGLGSSSLYGLSGSVSGDIADMNAQQSIYSGIGSGIGSIAGGLYDRLRGTR